MVPPVESRSHCIGRGIWCRLWPRLRLALVDTLESLPHPPPARDNAVLQSAQRSGAVNDRIYLHRRVLVQTRFHLTGIRGDYLRERGDSLPYIRNRTTNRLAAHNDRTEGIHGVARTQLDTD